MTDREQSARHARKIWKKMLSSEVALGHDAVKSRTNAKEEAP